MLKNRANLEIWGIMMMLKQRLLGIILTLVSAFIVYQTWSEAGRGGSYSLKTAAFAPLGVVGGMFLIFFPQFGGKPETTREKIVVMSVFAVGVIVGLFNWYLIDPQVFGF